MTLKQFGINAISLRGKNGLKVLHYIVGGVFPTGIAIIDKIVLTTELTLT